MKIGGAASAVATPAGKDGSPVKNPAIVDGKHPKEDPEQKKRSSTSRISKKSRPRKLSPTKKQSSKIEPKPAEKTEPKIEPKAEQTETKTEEEIDTIPNAEVAATS